MDTKSDSRFSFSLQRHLSIGLLNITTREILSRAFQAIEDDKPVGKSDIIHFSSPMGFSTWRIFGNNLNANG